MWQIRCQTLQSDKCNNFLFILDSLTMTLFQDGKNFQHLKLKGFVVVLGGEGGNCFQLIIENFI